MKLAGGVPVVAHPEDGSFYPTTRNIENVVGPYTKAVLLNNPNNPGGVVYPKEFIADIVDFCQRRNLCLIMDGTYNRLIFDGQTPTNCYEFAKDLSERSKLVVIHCVSKMYAVAGFRIGWAIGNKELIQAMANIQSQETSGLAPLAMGRSRRAQWDPLVLREPVTLENDRNVLVSRLQAIPGLKVVEPGGTFHCFPDFNAYSKDSQKLAEFLLEKVRVVMVPGKEFGREGYLRISFCRSISEIKEGAERTVGAGSELAQRNPYRRQKTGDGLDMNICHEIESLAWKEAEKFASDFGLASHGILNPRKVYWNLPTAALYEEAILRREGRVAHLSPLVVLTGKHTGRSAADKYIVRVQTTEEHVWWGEYNRPYHPGHFNALYNRMVSYVQGRDVFFQDVYAGADPERKLAVRVIAEKAWHSLFIRNMFIKPRTVEAVKRFVPNFTIVWVPSFRANPLVDQIRSETFILVNFGARLALLGGSAYGGEMKKKSEFRVMNF